MTSTPPIAPAEQPGGTPVAGPTDGPGVLSVDG